MVDNRPQDSTYVKTGVPTLLWPEAAGEDPETGEFLGYKMPYRDLEQTKSALRYAVTELKWDVSTPQERYRIANNLALVVNTIHEQGHAILDFNHDNILISEDGFITLIGCDAFHITDSNTSYTNDTYCTRYAPPEGLGSNMQADVQEADRFGIGVHVFQFLNEGFHPYHAQGSEAANGTFEDLIHANPFPYDADNANIRPHEEAPDYDQIPKEIKELFSECFRSGGRPYQDRPTPEEWFGVFYKLR
jgi:DNA-binding helix-hairpin-helix protein with protein kinase domain